MSQTQVTTVVDDQSPEILYNGQWNDVLNDSAAFDNSLSQAVEPGATFDFQFQGTAIYVYGAIQSGTTAVAANYSLDGSTPQTGVSFDTSSQDANQVMFYSEGGLHSVNHTLHVEVIFANSTNPYYLDYIAFVPMSTASSSAATYTTLPQPTSSLRVIVQTTSSTPVGAIVGGVVGGVAGLLILALAAFFFFFRRSGRRPYFYKSANSGEILDQEVKPFDAYPPPTTVTLTSSGAQSAPTSAPPGLGSVDDGSHYSSGSGSGSAPRVLSLASGSEGASSSTHAFSSPNQPRSKAAEAGLLSVARPATYHADSGVRFGSAGQGSSSTSSAAVHAIPEADVPADVPPMYSEN
ncbi:hypothetical protein BKA93DRAFT_824604 [Sparassis latifolia]|uniref:Uncharacterized protein n=1 Tax=Sparassis crispa TaxID=139825 RepID=A0A401GCK6_9APHY|nr:hypothetical protein SCP_0211200 [Sparassis crispa]GBE79918.1 hypothetical protein SCP_0211200 [Sparassis crispa]